MNTRVTRATLALAALGAACGLVLASSASASPTGEAREQIKPPAGIPILSGMALKTSDLSPGARVLRQGYVRPASGFVASYTRQFRVGARLRGKRFLYLENSIELLPNVADAQLFYNLVRLFSTRLDPDELAADFTQESGIKVRYVRIGRPVALRVGNQSFASRVRIGTRLGEFHVVTAVVRVDRIVAYVGIGGLPKTKVGTPEAKTLVRAVGRRMAQGLLPLNRGGRPAISGTAAVGQTLTASTGAWINNPTGYTYAWARCDAATINCTLIPGATARTYVLTAADGGFTIRVRVTARNARGSGVAISLPTRIVVGPPVNTMLPTISGAASVGMTLMVSPGSWSAGVTGYTYAWRRCDIAGANCVDIVGATGQSYVVAATDSGYTLRAAVTASSAHGPTTAVSAQTNLVP